MDLNHFQNKQLKYGMWVARLKLIKCKGNEKCSPGKWENDVMCVFFLFNKTLLDVRSRFKPRVDISNEMKYEKIFSWCLPVSRFGKNSDSKLNS